MPGAKGRHRFGRRPLTRLRCRACARACMSNRLRRDRQLVHWIPGRLFQQDVLLLGSRSRTIRRLRESQILVCLLLVRGLSYSRIRFERRSKLAISLGQPGQRRVEIDICGRHRGGCHGCFSFSRGSGGPERRPGGGDWTAGASDAGRRERHEASQRGREGAHRECRGGRPSWRRRGDIVYLHAGRRGRRRRRCRRQYRVLPRSVQSECDLDGGRRRARVGVWRQVGRDREAVLITTNAATAATRRGGRAESHVDDREPGARVGASTHATRRLHWPASGEVGERDPLGKKAAAWCPREPGTERTTMDTHTRMFYPSITSVTMPLSLLVLSPARVPRGTGRFFEEKRGFGSLQASHSPSSS